LVQAGFGTVDAVLPIPSPNGGQPNADGRGEAYFFSGTRYARIEFIPSNSYEKIIYGPANIADEWPALTKAGFKTVDAVLRIPNPNPNPDRQGEAYFFSGAQYVRIKVIPGKPDELIFGPANIADEWPALTKAGFKTVDAVLPIPNPEGEAYFFSGAQYARIKVIPGKPDELIFGPANIADHWPSLHWVW
ncbi:uncharacterized protein K441DRAFT_546434, partial [Cenococcum geophilum 1.58]|uniref:uncharacterized protein n=1 Tax=Cenococcum geophilum 1.58 TaxID=794803 RepID=UPI00358FADFC